MIANLFGLNLGKNKEITREEIEMAKKIDNNHFVKQVSSTQFEVLTSQEQYYKDVWVIISYPVELSKYSEEDILNYMGFDNLDKAKKQCGEDFDFAAVCAIADKDSSIKHKTIFSGSEAVATEVCQKR